MLFLGVDCGFNLKRQAEYGGHCASSLLITSASLSLRRAFDDDSHKCSGSCFERIREGRGRRRASTGGFDTGHDFIHGVRAPHITLLTVPENEKCTIRLVVHTLLNFRIIDWTLVH